MHERPPAALLFDLDRTLCESTQDFQAVLESTFERVGVDAYCNAEDMKAVIPETPDVESNREFYEALFDLAADRVGAGDVPAWELAGIHEELVDYSQVRFREGAEVALEAAREASPVGLVTNGGRETQTTKLEALGIADAFDVSVFCDPTAGVPPKPDPTAIEHAVAELGVDAADCLFVGDSKASDVAGAHAAGVRSAWVPYDESSDDADHDPHHVLGAPDEVVDLVS